MIPFNLKNVGATYQRLVNQMFAQQIGRMTDVYMDDTLFKSLYAKDHLTHLTKMFDVFCAYKIKLNSKKCTFEVFLWKLLVFMVNQRS